MSMKTNEDISITIGVHKTTICVSQTFGLQISKKTNEKLSVISVPLSEAEAFIDACEYIYKHRFKEKP